MEGNVRMNEMTKYEKWFELDRRSVRAIGKVFSVEEMGVHGILEVVNYEGVMGDGMDDDERYMYVVRRGLGEEYLGERFEDLGKADEFLKAMAVVSAIRQKRGGVLVRVYSGIVFRNQFFMNIYVMRHPMEFGGMNFLSRLCN